MRIGKYIFAVSVES